MKSCVPDLGTWETTLLGRLQDFSETRHLGRGEGDGDMPQEGVSQEGISYQGVP